MIVEQILEELARIKDPTPREIMLMRRIIDIISHDHDQQFYNDHVSEILEKYYDLHHEESRKNVLLKKISVTDPLTGIYNRRKFNELLHDAIKKYRNRTCDVGILMLDIDHFKQINDQYGHKGGDIVLIRLTEVVSNVLRHNDVFARWGGEEFAILLKDVSPAVLAKRASEIRQHVAQTTVDAIGSITVSIGATALLPTDDGSSVINRADQALYIAKREGRNRVHCL